MTKCVIDKDVLEEIQWQWKPWDDWYHKESGYYCPVCCNEKSEGHMADCEIAISLAQGEEK